MDTTLCVACFTSSASRPFVCVRCNVDELSTLRRRIRKRRADVIAKLNTAAVQARRRRTQLVLESFSSDLTQLRSRLTNLQDDVAAQRIHNASRREGIKVRRARLRAWRERLQSKRAALFGSDGLAAPVIEGLRRCDADLSKRTARKRQGRARQLLEIFPIAPPVGRTALGTIANLALPSWETIRSAALRHEANQSSGVGGVLRVALGAGAITRSSHARSSHALDCEHIAAALALVVRLVQLASSYLSLSLPYRMEFHGSWAAVGKRHPTRGEEMHALKFAAAGQPHQRAVLLKGIQMLRRNVACLCFYQGIPVADTRGKDLLENLWQLLHSPALGQGVRLGLHYADAQEEAQRARAPELQARRRRINTLADGSIGEIKNVDAGEGWNLLDVPQPPLPSQDDAQVEAYAKVVLGE